MLVTGYSISNKGMGTAGVLSVARGDGGPVSPGGLAWVFPLSTDGIIPSSGGLPDISLFKPQDLAEILATWDIIVARVIDLGEGPREVGCSVAPRPRDARSLLPHPVLDRLRAERRRVLPERLIARASLGSPPFPHRKDLGGGEEPSSLPGHPQPPRLRHSSEGKGARAPRFAGPL